MSNPYKTREGGATVTVFVPYDCHNNCPFCINKKEYADCSGFSLEKIIESIRTMDSITPYCDFVFTGGEPLVKKNIVSICRRAAAVEGIREVCLTTNGLLLPQMAKELREAGVKRLNLSLDTLDPQKYAYITRIGQLEDFKAGLEAALEAGFDKVKINAVLIGGFNDDEITHLAGLTMQYPVDVRFIEMMPMYDSGDFDEMAYIPYTRVLEALPEAVPVEADGGVAKLYRLPGALGNIGLISPVSAHFCGECNRIRLTADGKLKPCLHSADEYSLKGLDFDGMKQVLRDAIWNKPAWHGDLDAVHRSQAGRNMNQIGG